jgi:hypothetical protein
MDIIDTMAEAKRHHAQDRKDPSKHIDGAPRTIAGSRLRKHEEDITDMLRDEYDE